jgi:hypothetical protein
MRFASPLLLLAAAPGLAADAYKDGWTPKALGDAVAACTETLTQGAWKNTLKDQQMDEKTPLTPEIRKKLEPQIAGLKTLCDCTIKATAKKYGKKDYETQPDAMDRYAIELVHAGTCKRPF